MAATIQVAGPPPPSDEEWEPFSTLTGTYTSQMEWFDSTEREVILTVVVNRENFFEDCVGGYRGSLTATLEVDGQTSVQPFSGGVSLDLNGVPEAGGLCATPYDQQAVPHPDELLTSRVTLDALCIIFDDRSGYSGRARLQSWFSPEVDGTTKFELAHGEFSRQSP